MDKKKKAELLGEVVPKEEIQFNVKLAKEMLDKQEDMAVYCSKCGLNTAIPIKIAENLLDNFQYKYKRGDYLEETCCEGCEKDEDGTKKRIKRISIKNFLANT